MYTCIGKGGSYEVVGTAIGAGTSRENGVVTVYRDTNSGQLFYRQPDDFEARMEKASDND